MATEAARSDEQTTFGPQAVEILERISQGFYAIDREWRLAYVNRAAELFWSLRRENILGRSMLELFPKFRGSPAHEAHARAMATGTPVRTETISTATGVPVELNLNPAAPGLWVFFQDISHRLQLERRLRERDELLSLAELHAGIGVWDSDLATRTMVGTPQFFRLHGFEPIMEPVSIDLPRSVRHPADRDRIVRDFTDAIAAGADTFESEYRIQLPDGETRWIFGRGRVVRDAAGVPIRYSGVDIDITERKQQEEQLKVVTHELRHRANNLLAVIQAMARQTTRASRDLADFEERFEGRIRSMADSNDLLVRQDFRGVPLSNVVETHLRPFAEIDGRRVSADGPRVILAPKTVQTLGLALHELATNASKYGALSVPDGRIAITWGPAENDPERIGIEWRESGGPPVTQPSRKGFGSFVVLTMVENSLDAEVSIDFAESGVIWSMTMPREGATTG